MNRIKMSQFLVLVFIMGCNSINSTSNVNVELGITPTVTQLTNISNTCLQEEKVDLENLDLNGNIVVYQNQIYRMFDTDKKAFITIPEPAHISPDGEKIAQYDDAKNGIRVSSLDGDSLMFFPRESQWVEANSTLYGNVMNFDENIAIFNWWNNHFLYILSLPIGSQFMLDVETGETYEVEYPYVNEVWAFGGAFDIRNNFVRFSPDFDKVVYASTAYHLVLRNNSIYSDRTWRTVIWVGYSYAYSNPTWSPDGSTFVAVMGKDRNINDLFQVYADFAVGEKQLTDLGTLFNSPYQISITQVSWSPNGKTIAFIAHVTPKEGSESFSKLLVLDVATGNIEDYCNPDAENPYSTNSFSFTWSPDGKYIATDTTIVNLVSRIAYKFPDLYIVDWVGEGKSR